MIPSNIFFAYTSLPDSHDKPFAFIHYLAIKSAAIINKYPIRCYYEIAPTGPYWVMAQRYMTPIQYPVPHEIAGIPLIHPSHRADVVRLQVLRDEGGIYLDLDVICVKPFSDLLNHHVVMGRESPENLCTGVILSEPRSPIITMWLDGYNPATSLTKGFDPNDWAGMSTMYATLLSRLHPEWITVLGPHAFHFPAFDSPRETRQMFYKNHPPLPDAYCHHLYEARNWRLLSHLTSQDIRHGNTNFYNLLKQFLPDD